MEIIYFSPGCALSLYKPELVKKVYGLLKSVYPKIEMHTVCCHYYPHVHTGATIINVCAGCNRRFNTYYSGVSGITLWEIIDGFDGFESFKFPDYQGLEVSVHDPCPVRDRPKVHSAVRSLLTKMNCKIIESEKSGTGSVCCGDSFYPELPIEQVHYRMQQRAQTMPCKDVVVYCVSCTKSMEIGGKRPHHLLDMLFDEPTFSIPFDTKEWHDKIAKYRVGTKVIDSYF